MRSGTESVAKSDEISPPSKLAKACFKLSLSLHREQQRIERVNQNSRHRKGAMDINIGRIVFVSLTVRWPALLPGSSCEGLPP